ncbi:MAG: endoplasmic oxidoreductin-1 [Claussenomyces sp. TS43310]|nr:MAG: endoplasmic oxidoreductin-1 [Claussenomyces sp. TS43310]
MRAASRVFYLAVFSLLGTSHAHTGSASQSESPVPDVCAIDPKAIVSDACATYSTLDQLNAECKPALNSITKSTDFFAYYRLNLFGKECPFWNDANAMCGNIACAVNTLDNEEDVPEIWRAEELSKLEGPKAGHPGKKLQAERGLAKPLQGELGDSVGESCVVEYDDECDERDYCVPEDASAGAKGDYVSLVDNPERFTGYAGEGTKMVWDSIYKENCFSRSSFGANAEAGKSPFPDGAASHGLKSILFKPSQGPTKSDVPLDDEDECLEKRVFYRVISGMHASISMHLCYEYLDQTTGQWGPNLTCYMDRLHTHPERISNLYFNYAMVLRAVAKLGPYLKSYTFCTGDAAQDQDTRAKVLTLTEQAAAVPQIFNESLMFVDGEGPSLKEDFRNRFRNVSRLMDCVGCDKCRLWGKVQTAGYGAALKVLFEFGNGEMGGVEEQPQLKRTELVALFNTLSRISSSVSAVRTFRDMVEAKERQDADIGGKGYQTLADAERKAVGQDDVRASEEDDDDEDMERLREELRDMRGARTPGNQTLREAFTQEFVLVWKVFKHIMKSYLTMPQNIWQICILELNRFWEFFIGLPVTPRTWRIARPRLDEL